MKTFFVSLDQTSKRIFVISVSISMVLLSASFLMLTINRALATSPARSPLDIVGVGCDESFVYYYNSFGQLYRERKSGAEDR